MEGLAARSEEGPLHHTFFWPFPRLLGAAALVMTSYLHPGPTIFPPITFDLRTWASSRAPDGLVSPPSRHTPGSPAPSRRDRLANRAAQRAPVDQHAPSASNILGIFRRGLQRSLPLSPVPGGVTGSIFVFRSGVPMSPPPVGRHMLEAIALPSDAPTQRHAVGAHRLGATGMVELAHATRLGPRSCGLFLAFTLLCHARPR